MKNKITNKLNLLANLTVDSSREYLQKLRDLDFYQKIEVSHEIFRLSNPKAKISASGGGDSSVMVDLYEKALNRKPSIVFFNTGVDPKGNRDIIKGYKKNGYDVEYRKPKITYKEICWESGFPIGNKEFAGFSERLRRNLSIKNVKDRYRLITGVSDLGNSKIIVNNNRYLIPLKQFYLVKTFPLQSSCCDILKKNLIQGKETFFVGVMHYESSNRQRMVQENGIISDKKVFPLAHWVKADIQRYVREFGLKISSEYSPKWISDTLFIDGATSTGCEGCGFGMNDTCYLNRQSHNIIGDYIQRVQKLDKFEKMKLVYPKKYDHYMNMQHKSGATFREVLEIFNDSKKGKYIKESIDIRNKEIDNVIKVCESNNIDFNKALLESFKDGGNGNEFINLGGLFA